MIMVAAVGLVAAGVTWAVANPLGPRSSRHAGVTDNSYPTSLASVERRTISSQTPVNATLDYAGSYQVVDQATGTYTWLPPVGQVVSEGQVLYRVDGSPTVLLYGSTPAYRGLSEGSTGADVGELNADLLALGYATDAQLSPTSDYFGWATAAGLEKLQAAAGLTQNGRLTLGQAIFLPGSARITTITATLGGPASAGQPALSATSTARQVTIALDAALQSEVKEGDQVTITLPDNTTTPGVITFVGTVATTPSSSNGPNSGSATPTVTVEATPTDPAATGSWDQAPVQVSITTASVPNALVVPVDAVLALSNAGYALEVVDDAGVHHLVDVDLGIFDAADNSVQVTGSSLVAGQRVVVPGS